MSQRAIVMGASAGGVETRREVVSQLSTDLPAPVFVVLHIPPFVSSSLPEILSKSGPLPVVHPRDGARMEDGFIYIASPDHHLLIELGHVAVKRGPKKTVFAHQSMCCSAPRLTLTALAPSASSCPAHSTAARPGSGASRARGIAIVQQPNQARLESMPGSALDYIEVDYNLPSTEIGALLVRLVNEQPEPAVAVKPEIKARMAKEVQIATENGAFQKGSMELGILTPFTCPECHGALVKIAEGQMSRFRRHTGHAYTDNALLEAVMETSGEMLWPIIRSLEEGVLLLNHMGQH